MPVSDLEKLGWSDRFAAHMNDDDGLTPARVVAEHRLRYRVQLDAEERSAQVSGRLRHHSTSPAELPAVGDWVAVQRRGAVEPLVIERVLPRTSKFSRKVAGARTEEHVVAANVDYVWIVTSLDQDFSLRRIERYLTLAWESGARPVVVLTKADLHENAEQCRAAVESVALATPVHVTSMLSGSGVDELYAYLNDHSTVALLGSSGVGKSTLINALDGKSLQETSEVRNDGKGRHTTTRRQLIRLSDGGSIVDTPGLREIQLWNGDVGLSVTFEDVETFARQCRFSDCRHAGEPGCAVTEAVVQGTLSRERCASYQKLQRELAHLERKTDALARKAEKQRHKSVMKSLRRHPKHQR